MGCTLPGGLRALLEREAHAEGESLAFVICTVDEAGRPHPAMLSSLEVAATGAEALRLATYDSSRTAANLAVRGLVTLVVVEPGAVYYVTGHAEPSTTSAPRGYAFFDVRVDEVRIDETDAAREGHVRITSGIQFAADDVHWEKAREMWEALKGNQDIS